jgi:hypothetical protein
MKLSVSQPNLFYFNPLFDLELGGHPVESVAASSKQMSPLFALMGTDRDRVLLDVKVSGDYGEYLSAQGIDHARPAHESEDCSGCQGVPWGWNSGSIGRLTSFGAQCSHPDLATVKTVNNRQWCAALNHGSKSGVPGSRFCSTSGELEAALGQLADRFPLVAKPAFGSSGYGFVRMRDRAGFSPAQRQRVEAMVRSAGCTVEPWLDRIADLSGSCVVCRDGSVTDLCHYRCHVTGHGAFYGISIGGQDPLLDRYGNDLRRIVGCAAAALANEGYFGPASVDSVVYREGVSGRELLAPMVEINARQVMSAIARALYRKTGNSGCSLFRFIGRNKARLPERYDTLANVLGNDRYDPEKKRGVLLVSPLRVAYGKEAVQPARSAFFLRADTVRALWEMDARLRALFG